MARSELMEETGLRAGVLQLLGEIHLSVGLSPQAGQVFLATDLEEGRPNRSVEEWDLAARHLSVAQLQQLITDGGITDAATLAAWALFVTRFGIPVSGGSISTRPVPKTGTQPTSSAG